jgi:hypothetical protein
MGDVSMDMFTGDEITLRETSAVATATAVPGTLPNRVFTVIDDDASAVAAPATALAVLTALSAASAEMCALTFCATCSNSTASMAWNCC